MTELRRIRVEGLVQGVNFRAEARREAQLLGVNGFARNESDGSVLIEAEGDPEPLDRFVAWCRHGEPPARVDRVTVEAGRPVGHVGFARR